MRGAGVLVGLILALGVGYVAFGRTGLRGRGQAPPQEQIDVVAIRQTLLTIGQAERQFLLAHGSYGTVADLAQDKLLPDGFPSAERGYVFTGAVEGASRFTITAAPTDPNKIGWPTFFMTEAMQVAVR